MEADWKMPGASLPKLGEKSRGWKGWQRMVTSEAAGKVETTGGTYMWRLEAWKKRKILGMIYAEF